jgi:NSS family neurotransmitter:Na+ symporter
MEREKLKSRLGFILLSAGCAIGIGNVWKFPWLVGQNGGGLFVLIYLFFLLILGVPVMTMEFAMGRASRKSPVKLYDALAPKGSHWHLHGPIAMIGNYILMMFYTTVAGWMLSYFAMSATGTFAHKSPTQVQNIFNQMLKNPAQLVIAMGIVVVLGFFINAQGLQNGLEKITKVMMIALLIIMVVLAVNSLFLPGAAEGTKFYLFPSVKRIEKIGLLNVIVAAMNQAFFTLSVGMGGMAIFGSYIDKKHALLSESINVAFLDTFVAIVSGLIIFPACFAYHVKPNSGPSLIFITLPNIFNHMPLGRLWGSLFFVFMSFAAFSTVLAVFENIMACTMDLFSVSRKQAALINVVLVFLLSLPCALGFNVLSGIHPLGAGTNFMDLEDFLVSNIILPGGSFIFVLFCTRRYGWGWEHFKKEANTGKGLKITDGMRFYMTWILPVIILLIIILGLIH